MQHIRLFATRHLSSLMRLASPSIPSWQTHLLVPQLYDSAPEVVYLALEVLEQACAASVETLEKVVEMRPALDLLGERAEGLLIQCVLRRFFSAVLQSRYGADAHCCVHAGSCPSLLAFGSSTRSTSSSVSLRAGLRSVLSLETSSEMGFSCLADSTDSRSRRSVTSYTWSKSSWRSLGLSRQTAGYRAMRACSHFKTAFHH